MESKPIAIFKTKAAAQAIAGGCTQTSKMPCESYSLPTAACKTGAKLAQIEGSICSECYANKGFYKMYAKQILPAQQIRLESIKNEAWVPAMIKLIGKASHFRWHDSGDLQSLEHLEKIAAIAQAMPDTLFWLPTREYGIVKTFAAAQAIPKNLIIRLSAMYFDKPVTVPKSLQGLENVLIANVHKNAAPRGFVCNAPANAGKCGDCRACWSLDVPAVTYHAH
jgi:hypothetical protein